MNGQWLQQFIMNVLTGFNLYWMKKWLPQCVYWERGVVFGEGNASMSMDFSLLVSALKRTK